MKSLAQFVALTLLPLLLLGAECQPSPVTPTPPAAGGSVATGGSPATGGVESVAGAAAQTGGAPSDGGLAACIAFASASEGVRNVAAKSGVSLVSAVAEICSSPALRSCYAESRCK